MQIDPKILGPYQSMYLKALEAGRAQAAVELDEFVATALGKKGTATSKESTSRRANFTALYKKQSIKFLQGTDARRQDRQKEMEVIRKGHRSNAVAKGRPATITEVTNELNKMIQDNNSQEISNLETTSSPSDSIMDMSTSSSTKDMSKISIENGDSAAVTDKTSVNTVSSINSKPNLTKNAKSAPQQDQNRKPAATKPSRHDQLQKWKKEKEAADKQTKRTMKEPFKVGAPVKTTSTTTLVKSVNSTANSSTLSNGLKNSAPSSAPVSTKQPLRTGGGVASRVAPEVKNKSVVSKAPPKAGTTVPPSKQEVARPVTRAMSKAQTNTTSMGTSKPPISKMKALNINEKPVGSKPTVVPRGAALVPNKSSHATTNVGRNGPISSMSTKPGTSVKSQIKETKGKDNQDSKVPKDEVVHDDQGKGLANPHDSNLQHTDNDKKPQEQETRKKKAKPKAIDETYTDYNGRFSDACRKLGGISKEWRPILEEQKDVIPEDIQDDIYSALGKVKLLLESKLPQFGELLFAYLLKDQDATIILACDLEGWWDVAYIQVDAVYSIFESLNTIRNNSWKKPDVSIPSSKLTKKSSSEEEESGKSQQLNKGGMLPPATLKPKAQASGGLKAFLANKRKMFNKNPDCISNGDANEPLSKEKSEETLGVTVESKPTPSIPESEATTCPETLESSTPTNIKSRLSLNLKTNLNESHHRKNTEDSSNNKLFEGGFFMISSPMATRNTDSIREETQMSLTKDNVKTPVSAVPGSFRTPNRPSRFSSVASEGSLRRASLSMLGVRRSMGSFSKIGAVSIFPESNAENDV